ncbi:MAG: TIGR03960 family B12-binding radical SAM protein [candidate division Zixibacteria bacterium]|nr:TIGR03960 family B12-binding radical SAM protein [candidate division Zixibacteria bacterium]
MNLEHFVPQNILPLVQKPARYAGGELGSIKKDPSGKLKFCLCFPDLYEIGMSNLGMQIIYHRINSFENALCERAFSAAPDFEEKLKEHNVPLYSLESFMPLREFDFVGFSVEYELAYSNILDMLDLARIPLKSAERSGNDPIIIAGGPAILNPEPIADFIDAFFIGDGEEIVSDIIERADSDRYRDADRHGKLKILSDIGGCYIPGFYKWDNNGSLIPVENGIPEKIRVRACSELKNDYYPYSPIIPNIETVHDRLTVELMRGCPRGCRFCQAGYQYRPRRERPPEDIIRQVKDVLAKTGYDEVSLQSLSSTDYSQLEGLLSRLNSILSGKRVSLALPSFRSGTLSVDTLKKLDSGRRTGITMAPEAGTQRLRDVVNKDITEDEIIETAEMVFSNGWNNIKLYFMIGLPTETAEDIQGIIKLIRDIESIARKYGGRNKVNVTISPFVPKPLTPFQWEKQITLEEILEKYRLLRTGLKSKKIDVRFHHAENSVIEGILCRGGRELGDVLRKIHEYRLRLQSWSEYFDYDRWLMALRYCEVDYQKILGGYEEDNILPWSHVTKGIPERFFKSEKEKAYRNEPLRKRSGKTGSEKQISEKSADSGSFGRKKRKTQNSTTLQLPESVVRIRWTRDESLRFLSHKDNIRLFQRAIRRADLPVEYSQGFSPRPKLSFGPPLAVGFTSEDEYIDIKLNQPFQNSMLVDLQKTLPDGIELKDAVSGNAFMNSVSKLINLQKYIITTDYDLKPEIINELPEQIIARRVKDNDEFEIDIRPGLHDIKILDNNRIELVNYLNRPGVGRPVEYLVYLLNVPEKQAQTAKFHRVQQYNFEDGEMRTVFEIST